MSLPTQLEALAAAFVQGLDGVLGGKLHAVYVLGAIAFPEGDASGDVDFHVMVRERLTPEEKAGLQELHAALARDYPPAGADMDGYYLLLEEARRSAPPEHQFLPGVFDSSWALHCAHVHGGRTIRLRGPDPREIYPMVSWPDVEAALWGEMAFVEKHLSRYPDYAILQLCRLMYSFQTRDVVVSKRFCEGWAADAFPQWASLIRGARASYERGHPDEDQRALAGQVGPFYEFAVARIRAYAGRARPAEGGTPS